MARLFVFYESQCELIAIENHCSFKKFTFTIEQRRLRIDLFVQRYDLKNKDFITIDGHIIGFDLCENETWYLFSLKDNCLIGRDDVCDISIDSKKISKKHCEIKQKEGSFIIFDLNSTNGVYVDKKKSLKTELRSVDEIVIGDVILYFVSGYLILNRKVLNKEAYPKISCAPLISVNTNCFVRKLRPVEKKTVEIESPVIYEKAKKPSLFSSIGSSIMILASSILSSIVLSVFSKTSFDSILSTMFSSLSMSIAFFIYGWINRNVTYKRQCQIQCQSESMYLNYLEEIKNKICEVRQELINQVSNNKKLFTILNDANLECFKNELMLSLCTQKVDLIELKYSKMSYLNKNNRLFQKRDELIKNTNVFVDELCLIKKNQKIWIKQRTNSKLLDSIFMQFCWCNLSEDKRLVFLVKDKMEVLRYTSHPNVIIDEVRLVVSNQADVSKIKKCLDARFMYLYVVTDSRFIHCFDIENASFIYIGKDHLNLNYDQVIENDFIFTKYQNDKVRQSIKILNQRNQKKKLDVVQLLSKRSWKHKKARLDVVIGYDESKEEVEINLAEDKHGPHALVAGMTGSGKSQWLSNLLMMLIINNPPSLFQYVLIDFKGEAFGQAFLEFDHCAGLVSNLNEDSIQRFVLSMNQEIKRRQFKLKEMLEKFPGVIAHVDVYNELFEKDPISHLFVVIDEFAQLKSRFSEHLHSLIEMARIGRSLGIHLILSTQKPMGIVDEQIWSNTNLKVCLKVNSASDSREVLHHEKAAYLQEAGQFIIQVHNQGFEKQGQAYYLHDPLAIGCSFREVDFNDETVMEKVASSQETIYQYLSNKILGLSKGHKWVIMPDLSRQRNFKDGFILIDLPFEQNQKCFELEGSMIVLTNDPDKLVSSICSYYSHRNIYLYGFKKYQDYVDDCFDEIDFLIKVEMLDHEDILIVGKPFDYSLLSRINCRVVYLVHYFEISNLKTLSLFQYRLVYAMNDIENIRYFFNEFNIQHNLVYPKILYRGHVCDCIFHRPVELLKKQKKKKIQVDCQNRFLLGFDHDEPCFWYRKRPIVFCFIQRSIKSKILKMCHGWKQLDDSLKVGNDLKKTCDIYVLYVPEINHSDFEMLQYDIDIVWMGLGFMEHGYFIKRKLPMTSDTNMIYWSEDEVHSLKENGIETINTYKSI